MEYKTNMHLGAGREDSSISTRIHHHGKLNTKIYRVCVGGMRKNLDASHVAVLTLILLSGSSEEIQ